MSSLPLDLRDLVERSRILLVGAGGIGCELLKNLVLTGFNNIDVVDLDTIELSNLNRQFLFQKQHVAQPKAKVAAEAVMLYNPSAKVNYHHCSIMNAEFDVEFFKTYDLVMNALDNRAARSHVNRMCLAADKPLIESGTSGYLGQVSVIKKGLFECYECVQKPAPKTFPGCTIRNTPSEPIHCIVWAKHLFNQLFGEADIDEDVSPDMHDPELTDDDKVDAGSAVTNGKQNGSSAVQNGTAEAEKTRISTSKWAMDCQYDPKTLFHKLFHDDIEYLLSMHNLWKKRRPPTPLNFDQLEDAVAGSSSAKEAALEQQRVWSPETCREVFIRTVMQLKQMLETKAEGSVLVWDKDDDVAVDFVVACANLRAYIFGIPLESKFNVKSMAGNIIPAIATTNAVIAGIIVTEGLRILRGHIDKCKCAFLSRIPNPRCKILVDMFPEPPNPKCYVCSPKPEVLVKLNINTFVIKNLKDKILKAELHMIAPDVEVCDGSGRILISSEEGETKVLEEKTLGTFGLKSGDRLTCDDFMQHFNLHLILQHCDGDPDDDKDFEIVSGGDITAKTDQEAEKTSEQGVVVPKKRAAEVGEEEVGVAKKRRLTENNETDMHIID